MNHVLTWDPAMRPLGRVMVAIGVFDGVHRGHQALLARTARDAMRTGAHSVALTFDRDPDQVVTPASAAPQLLTLSEKTALIRECGISYVVIVPFTPTLAAMPAEEFLDTVLARIGEVVGVHVGADFRFGARAQGDIDTLYVWGVEHNADVTGHELLEVEGAAVTSTRIRELVKAGDVEGAARLLGRPPRVFGTVRRGRGDGARLGFPTANVLPGPFAALPADGVYAGLATLDDGSTHAAAIVVGRPPTFPEAADFLEAHLIGFSGDLYDRSLSLEFVARLRDQRQFASLAELTGAIGADVDQAASVIASFRAGDPHGEEWHENPFEAIAEKISDTVEMFVGDSGDYYDDEDIVEDPVALERAEREVADVDPMDAYDQITEDWVEVVEPRHLSGVYSVAGVTAVEITGPLTAAGVPFAWDPYPPEQAPGYRPAFGTIDRPYSLLVPASRAQEARTLLGDYERRLRLRTRPMEPMHGLPGAGPAGDTEPVRTGRLLFVFAVLIGIPLLTAIVSYAARLMG